MNQQTGQERYDAAAAEVQRCRIVFYRANDQYKKLDRCLRRFEAAGLKVSDVAVGKLRQLKAERDKALRALQDAETFARWVHVELYTERQASRVPGFGRGPEFWREGD
jgi:DNA-binding helix-hairpin-helix protein with protein kinase domain